MEMNSMETNGSKQESNPTVLTACPDKEESGERKIWPEFWQSGGKRGRLWNQLSSSQLRCMTDFYMNKSTNSKPKIKITDWNAYFGVTNAKNGDPLGEISP